jgi:hypothetical protein
VVEQEGLVGRDGQASEAGRDVDHCMPEMPPETAGGHVEKAPVQTNSSVNQNLDKR